MLNSTPIAKLVLKLFSLGYLHGMYLESGCNNVNGQNVCAGKGYPVAVAGIMVWKFNNLN